MKRFILAMSFVLGTFAHAKVIKRAPIFFDTQCVPLQCVTKSENLPIGDSEILYMGTRAHLLSGGQFGSLSFSGSPDFQIISDSCSNTNVSANTMCYWEVQYTPTPATLAGATATVSISFNPSDPTYPTYSQTYDFVGRAHAVDPLCSNKKPGSIVDTDSRVLGERIPIVGTDFFLSYSSRFAPQYGAYYSTFLGTKPEFNPEVWTVSNHHYYDALREVLFRGDGTIANVKSTPDGAGHNLVISAEGDDIYSFDATTGAHVSTLSALTGATRYTFGYTSNRLTSIQDAYGNQTTFNRTGGNLTSIVAPFGQTTTITLNGAGQISAVQDPAGGTYTLGYLVSTALLNSFTKPGTQVSTFSYDGNGYLDQDLGNGGNEWNLSQTGTFLTGTITLSSALGRTSTHQKSQSSGVYTRIDTHPDGNVNTHTQNPDGSIQDADNRRTVVTSTTPDARFGSLFQSVASRALTMGATTSTTTYSQSVNYPSGPLPTWFNYSTLVRSETTSGRTTISSYDSASRTLSSTSPEGATSAIQFNTYEQPTQMQIGSDTAWTYSYDVYGRLDGKAQGTKNAETYTYDASGNLSAFTNARSEVTSFSHDLNGRVTQITLPDTRVIGKTYDANGNLATITPPSRPAHTFTLNGYELLDTYAPPPLIGTVDTTYSFNTDKQLTGISRPDGQSVSYTYDATSGNLTTITTPIGNYSYTYSGTDQNISSITAPGNVRNEFTYLGTKLLSDEQIRPSDSFSFGKVSFTYDTDFRLASRTVKSGASGATSTINYTYNDDDQPILVGNLVLSYSYPSGRLASTTLNNITDSYTYDAYGNLETYTATYTPTSTVLYSYTLTRDLASRITAKSETILGTTTNYGYTFDTAGRLTVLTVNGSGNSAFTYDSNSNRTSGTLDAAAFTATFDNQDRIDTFNSRTYSFNANGDLSSILWPGPQTSSYTYDVLGNLRSGTQVSGTVLNFGYDGLNRRIWKTAAGTTIYRALYQDGLRMAAYVNPSLGTILKEWVYATGRNVPDYMKSGGLEHRIISDHLGSPRLVVQASTGAVAQRINYGVTGMVLTDTNPNFQPFGYAGGIYEPGLGFTKFGARDYDPRSGGRWTSKDPIRFDGGDTNLYGYVMNDPVNFVDPFGLDGMDQNFWNRQGERTEKLVGSLKDGRGGRIKAISDFCKETGEDALATIFGNGGSSGPPPQSGGADK